MNAKGKFNIEINEMESSYSNPIKIYNTEYCICNLLKNAAILRNYCKKWSRRQGSNLRPHGPKPRALPTALRLDNIFLLNAYI